MSDDPYPDPSPPLHHVLAVDAITDAYLTLRRLQDSAEAGLLYPAHPYLTDTYLARVNGRLEQEIEHCREIVWELANSLSAHDVLGFRGLPQRLTGQEVELRAHEKARQLAERSQPDSHS